MSWCKSLQILLSQSYAKVRVSPFWLGGSIIMNFYIRLQYLKREKEKKKKKYQLHEEFQ